MDANTLIKYYLYVTDAANSHSTVVDTPENRAEITMISLIILFLGATDPPSIYAADGLIFISIPEFAPDKTLSAEFEALISAHVASPPTHNK